MDYYAGIDMGGTKGRLRVCMADGQVLGEFYGEGCSINTDGPIKSRECFQKLVLPGLGSLGLLPEECRGICVAASGVDSSNEEMSCRSWFEEMGFPSERLLVLNDCEVFLYLSEEPSLILLSGTGSICCGKDRNGKKYRTGGWNHILSDEGSGFYFGLRYLEAVADVLDGRKKGTVLTTRIMEESGLDTLEKIDQFINRNLFNKAEIARFSKVGYQAACQGDETALGVHREGAVRLVGLVLDTWNKMDHEGNEKVELWLWGSVLVKNSLLQEEVKMRLKEQMPWLNIKIPEKSALETAVLAAMTLEGRKI